MDFRFTTAVISAVHFIYIFSGNTKQISEIMLTMPNVAVFLILVRSTANIV